MGSEWKSLQLGDICELRAGSVFPPALQGKLTGTYPFVKVSDMNLPANALYIQVANNWINDTEMVKLKAKPFPVGTTIFAKIGEALKANRLRFLIQPTILDNNMMGAIPTENEVDPRFFFYSLSQFDFGEIADGTALPYLTVNGLSKLPVMLPPLPEQHAIAHILGTLDDKIELNRRMNETLEAMARALFKSWFVDFDPVRAKIEGRDTGLPPEISDLFPDEFEDSELGEIPKGWDVKNLSELTTLITKGTTPTQGEINNSPDSNLVVNYVRANCIEENGTILADKLLRVPLSVHTGVLKRSILKSGDILYTIAGTIGRIALAEDWILPANTNQAIAIIRPASSVPPGFLILTMHEEGFRQNLHNNIVHAVQANLSLGMLGKAQGVVPPLYILPELFSPIEAILSRIMYSRAQSRTLSSLRDTLLPKLISGEIRVGEAEKYLEVVET